MATMRSALMMLARRSCGSSGSSASASMGGGRGLEVLFRTSAPSLPSLRPSTRNLLGWRRYSTESGEPRKAGSFLPMWWQRTRDRFRNASEIEKEQMQYASMAILLCSAFIYAVVSTWHIRRF